ncbi:MAG: aminotransferase class I/II-fold pyridoxal phosphate-dependent enzyme [Chloroflexi bacterium]|nr:aminotransferase class I/II-fold pyridoxal phosphate-dependent enzyme [Chloroflexota bacterium]
MQSDKQETIVIHSDRPHNESQSVSPPIFQTTTYAADTAEEFVEMATRPHHPQFYTRYGNPNSAQAESIIADLEGAESALVAATGMGAITTAVMTLVNSGDHIVAQESLYAGTLSLLEKLLPRYGVEVTFVDQANVAAFEAALRPNTRLIITETPSNPLMKLTDLRAIAAMAQARNITTIADNTFATPVNQRPIELAIDLVVHSATKYLGGHADLMAGVVAGKREMLERVWNTLIILGATLNGFDSWLLVRGLRTLPLRVQKHNDNAAAIAQFLAAHPQVDAVHYPGLETHPQYSLAKTQMHGFGGMLSFQVRGGYAATDRFMSGLKLIARAASLGGIHSLIVHPAAMWAGYFSEQGLLEKGILPNLVRLSVGIEDADDLVADIGTALDGIN